MTLNHTNLCVSSVPEARAFLEKYFGLTFAGGNDGLTVLIADGGFVLTLMKAKRDEPVVYPGFFHIGFFVESKEVVDSLNTRLREDGFEVDLPTQEHAYNFYMMAPGGFRIEVGA